MIDRGLMRERRDKVAKTPAFDRVAREDVLLTRALCYHAIVLRTLSLWIAG